MPFSFCFGFLDDIDGAGCFEAVMTFVYADTTLMFGMRGEVRTGVSTEEAGWVNSALYLVSGLSVLLHDGMPQPS